MEKEKVIFIADDCDKVIDDFAAWREQFIESESTYINGIRFWLVKNQYVRRYVLYAERSYYDCEKGMYIIEVYMVEEFKSVAGIKERFKCVIDEFRFDDIASEQHKNRGQNEEK